MTFDVAKARLDPTLYASEGYPEEQSDLIKITLKWMLDEVEPPGLICDLPQQLPDNPSPSYKFRPPMAHPFDKGRQLLRRILVLE